MVGGWTRKGVQLWRAGGRGGGMEIFMTLNQIFWRQGALWSLYHDILIDRLQNSTGIQGQALRWFRSYLSDRYHFVYLNGEASQLSPVKYGVKSV